MTIPEASQLVLQSGAIANNGELFVLDMGQPVNIMDLAENMIRLSGVQGIEIIETGLRPGEKLYEELLMAEEGLRKTAHEKIFIGKPLEFDQEKFLKQLEQLKKEAYQDGNHIRESVKEIVETYQYQETGEKSKKK